MPVFPNLLTVIEVGSDSLFKKKKNFCIHVYSLDFEVRGVQRVPAVVL